MGDSPACFPGDERAVEGAYFVLAWLWGSCSGPRDTPGHGLGRSRVRKHPRVLRASPDLDGEPSGRIPGMPAVARPPPAGLGGAGGRIYRSLYRDTPIRNESRGGVLVLPRLLRKPLANLLEGSTLPESVRRRAHRARRSSPSAAFHRRGFTHPRRHGRRNLLVDLEGRASAPLVSTRGTVSDVSRPLARATCGTMCGHCSSPASSGDVHESSTRTASSSWMPTRTKKVARLFWR